MPIYEYECEACGFRFEVLQRLKDAPRPRCTRCKGRVRRLISAPGLQFKGTGWYITDYARKGSAPSESSGTDGSGESADSKPAESKAGESKPPAPAPNPPPRRRPPARRRRR